LDSFINKNRWTFGHLSYNLKEELHHLVSKKEDNIKFPRFFFFTPKHLLIIKEDKLIIESEYPDEVYRQLVHEKRKKDVIYEAIQIQQKFTREEYLEKIRALQQHILRGDCYEINFCQEFFAPEVNINPADVYSRLTEFSPNPFAALYKLHDKFLICASPERFLTRKGKRLYSQPMKGTIKREVNNTQEDERLKKELMQSAKDQSENVMVVDLVRNDLSRICLDGSVKVDELFGVYTYPQVHQMISTISGELKPDVRFSEILEATFPMGSMTGAPKYKVMELIDRYEVSNRGIFSGSVGYFSPNGDFDFNVVIRSIMYNATSKYLSYQVGSGITFYSDPKKEWEECLLKAEAIRKVLSSPSR
jgi:para-aminobenzoate synthetase component 1